MDESNSLDEFNCQWLIYTSHNRRIWLHGKLWINQSRYIKIHILGCEFSLGIIEQEECRLRKWYWSSSSPYHHFLNKDVIWRGLLILKHACIFWAFSWGTKKHVKKHSSVLVEFSQNICEFFFSEKMKMKAIFNRKCSL